MEEENLTVRLDIRCSPEQKQKLAEVAKIAGLTVSSYARQILFNATPPRHSQRPSVDKDLLIQVLGQIGKIGSNINQIAHNFNATGAPPHIPALEEELTELKKLRVIINNAINPTP